MACSEDDDVPIEIRSIDLIKESHFAGTGHADVFLKIDPLEQRVLLRVRREELTGFFTAPRLNLAATNRAADQPVAVNERLGTDFLRDAAARIGHGYRAKRHLFAVEPHRFLQ